MKIGCRTKIDHSRNVNTRNLYRGAGIGFEYRRNYGPMVKNNIVKCTGITHQDIFGKPTKAVYYSTVSTKGESYYQDHLSQSTPMKN